MLVACAVVLMWASPVPAQPSPESAAVASTTEMAAVVPSMSSSKTAGPLGPAMVAAALPAVVSVPAAPAVKVGPAPVSPGGAWWALTVAQHSAVAFDAWSTRYSVSSGGRELNPLMRPFANSNALYPAMQIGPTVTDYVSLRMMRSSKPWVRRMWWVPQAALAAGSVVSGFHNISVANGLRH